jgi:hypothetical protein
VVEFQDDPVTHGIEDEYLLGSALLVAPVLDERTHRRVYLPPGGWFDFATKERLEGRRFIEVDAPLERLPMFAREGGVVPMGELAQHTGEAGLDPLRVELYGTPTAPAQTVRGRGDERVELSFDGGDDGRLSVRVEGAPGRVELVLFGHDVAGATVDGKPAELERDAGAGVRVTLEPGAGHAVLQLTPGSSPSS